MFDGPQGSVMSLSGVLVQALIVETAKSSMPGTLDHQIRNAVNARSRGVDDGAPELDFLLFEDCYFRAFRKNTLGMSGRCDEHGGDATNGFHDIPQAAA